jgi:hypothetical protein
MQQSRVRHRFGRSVVSPAVRTVLICVCVAVESNDASEGKGGVSPDRLSRATDTQRMLLSSSHSFNSTATTFVKRTRRVKGASAELDPAALQASLRLDALRQTKDHMKVPTHPHLRSSGGMK